MYVKVSRRKISEGREEKGNRGRRGGKGYEREKDGGRRKVNLAPQTSSSRKKKCSGSTGY